MVYYWWAAQTALMADWDTMGVPWVVRDSLWNASCASLQHQQQSEKAFNHSSKRSGQRFWTLSVPLHLQLHPCIPPSSSKLMVSIAIRHATNVRFFIVFCMCLSCVNRRYVLGCANWARPTLLLAAAFVVVVAADVNTSPGVWICHKWCAVPPQYPKNADGQLRNDQCTKADLIFKRVVCNCL